MPQPIAASVSRHSLQTVVGELSHRSALRLRWTPLALCFTGDALVIAAAVAAGWVSERGVDIHFAEGAFVTHFSSLQLLLLAAISVAIFFHRRALAEPTQRSACLWLWNIMAAGFTFLAIDESFAVHERFDLIIHEQFGLRQTPWTDRIDDVIVLTYGMAGLAALWLGRRELHRFRAVWPHITFAFTLFFIMVALDLLTNSYAVKAKDLPSPGVMIALKAWANIAEESTKILSEGAFLAAFIAMLAIAKRQHARRAVSAHARPS